VHWHAEASAPSQRLDAWLWCARVLRQRARCAELVAEGAIRVNRRATDKPHAAIRPGDVLTVRMDGGPVGGRVMVLEVLALAARRGPAAEARLLYREIAAPEMSCPSAEAAPYPGASSTITSTAAASDRTGSRR
jgi:ribosome-associated heat shock protein Hsp15